MSERKPLRRFAVMSFDSWFRGVGAFLAIVRKRAIDRLMAVLRNALSVTRVSVDD